MINFDPNILKTLVALIFYVFIGIFLLGSAMSVYTLVRYGKNKLLIVSVIATYVVIAASLYIVALSQFNGIKF